MLLHHALIEWSPFSDQILSKRCHIFRIIGASNENDEIWSYQSKNISLSHCICKFCKCRLTPGIFFVTSSALNTKYRKALILCSISICFVLPRAFTSSGIALAVSLLLHKHFICWKPLYTSRTCNNPLKKNFFLWTLYSFVSVETDCTHLKKLYSKNSRWYLHISFGYKFVSFWKKRKSRIFFLN